jgi:hypothetical protein
MEWSQSKIRELSTEIVEESLVNPQSLGQDAWGTFSWSDAHPAIGGGIGAFQWFRDRAALMEFLSVHAITYWKDFDNENEHKLFCQSLNEIISRAANGQSELIDEYNKLIKGYFQLEWFGTFDELINSNAHFPKKVRSYFYETFSSVAETRNPEIENTEAIPLSLVKEFSESIEQYGL